MMKKQAWKYMITIDLKKHHTRFSSINRIIIQPGYFNYIQYIPHDIPTVSPVYTHYNINPGLRILVS